MYRCKLSGQRGDLGLWIYDIRKGKVDVRRGTASQVTLVLKVEKLVSRSILYMHTHSTVGLIFKSPKMRGEHTAGAYVRVRDSTICVLAAQIGAI